MSNIQKGPPLFPSLPTSSKPRILPAAPPPPHVGARQPTLPPPGTISLAQAQQDMIAKLDSPTGCPCCGSLVKIYERKINAGMAVALCNLHVATWLQPTAPFHLKKTMVATNHYTADAYYFPLWGLLAAQGPTHGGEDVSGLYVFTKLGRDFVDGHVDLARSVILYNDQLLGFSVERTTIRQAFKDPFDYDALMRKKP